MEKGYYFVRFKGTRTWTIGCRGSGGYMPWEVMGSDGIFSDDNFEIGPKLEAPQGIEMDDRELL